MLLQKNKRILLCIGNMLYNINHQLESFQTINVLGMGGESILHNRNDHAI